jgi:hypothetical protein
LRTFESSWELLKTIEGNSFMGIFRRLGFTGFVFAGFVSTRTVTVPVLAICAIFLTAPGLTGKATGTVVTQDAGQAAAPAKAAPVLGTIKTISAGELTLTSDAGAEVRVSLPAEVKLLRVPPGSKDLKEAASIQLSELQAGDRILVRGKAGDAVSSLVASSIIAMKKSDLTEKQAHERDEWQKHGIGGLVKSRDKAGKITISTTSLAGNKDVTVVVGESTLVRRYAANSVKFDDAKPSTIAEIHAGDQLRARGTRSADGGEFAAVEIVSGSFRNISGTISAVDAGAGTITLTDLATKKPVEIKIAADSQLRKLSEMMAQRIAVRLKGGAPDAGGSATAGAAKPAGTQADAGGRGAGALANPAGAGAGGRTGAGNGGVAGPGGGPGGSGAGARGAAGGDLQQMLARLPASSLSDFQKGDVVMIVASAGQKDSQATAITLVGGVEPILQASPQGQGASILGPWSLSGGGGDAGTL